MCKSITLKLIVESQIIWQATLYVSVVDAGHSGTAAILPNTAKSA